MGIFRFGAEWDLGAFLLFVTIGVFVSYFCFLGTKKGIRKGRIYYIMAFIILWFFQTFRSINIGVDTADYVDYFKYLGTVGWGGAEMSFNGEILFNAYMYLVSRLSDNYTVLFAVNAFVTNGAMLLFVRHFFKKGDSFIMLPLFVLNYIYDMAAMRSSLAVAFVLLSFILLDKKKYVYCIATSIIAALFHTTTLIALVIIIYRLFLLRKDDRVKGTVIFMSAIMVALTIYLSVSSLQTALSDTKYSGYAEELGSGWLGIWNLVLAFILSVILIARNRKHHRLFNTFDIVNVVAIAICPVIVQLGAYRLAKYFLMFRILTYKTYLTELEAKQKESLSLLKIAEVIILLFGLFFYMGRMSMTGQLHYEFAPIF